MDGFSIFDKLIDASHGNANLLASIVVVLALRLIFIVIEFIWNAFKKKAEVSEQTLKQLAESLQRLETELKVTRADLGDVHKLKLDLRRYFLAVKTIAGEKWPEIRKSIEEESKDFP